MARQVTLGAGSAAPNTSGEASDGEKSDGEQAGDALPSSATDVGGAVKNLVGWREGGESPMCCTHALTHSPFPFLKGEDTRRGRTSSEAHRVGDSYHRHCHPRVSLPVVEETAGEKSEEGR